MSEDHALNEVIRRLVQALDPREIWLFGSRAEGGHAPDSDFDLLVVTRAESGEAGSDYDAAYAPIKGLGVGCDVIPCRADEFETERHDPTSLCWVVIHTGKKLYERAEQPGRAVAAFRSAAMRCAYCACALREGQVPVRHEAS